jgi:O-antigen/teichoic acid export membrane protein
MSAVSVGRQLLNLPLGLLSAVILTRLFAPADYGRFGILVFLASLPLMVGDLGLSQAFIRKREEPSTDALAAASALQIGIALVAFPAVLLVGGRAVGSLDARSALTIALLYLPTLGTGTGLRANVLISRRLDFARLAALDLIQQAGYLVLLFVTGRAGLGTLGLAITATVTQCARLAVLAWWYPPRLLALPRFRLLAPTIRDALPLYLSGVVSGFHAGLPNWLGTPLFGPAAVGFLRWSLEMTNRVGMTLAQSVGRVVLPTVALLQGEVSRLQRVVGRACRYNLLVVGVPLALLAGLADPVISAVFGGRWTPAGLALQVYAVHMTAGALVIALDSAVQVVRRTTWTLGVWVAYLAAQVALSLLLAPALGFIAIPVAQATATVTKALVLRSLLPAAARPGSAPDLLLPAAAALAAFAAARMAAGAFSPWLAILAGGPIGALAAAALVFLLGRGTVWPDLLHDLRSLAPERPAA